MGITTTAPDERQQLSAPALVRHTRAFGRNLVGRRIEQVSHHLPPDGGIGIKQPVNNRHVGPSSFDGMVAPVA